MSLAIDEVRVSAPSTNTSFNLTRVYWRVRGAVCWIIIVTIGECWFVLASFGLASGKALGELAVFTTTRVIFFFAMPRAMARLFEEWSISCADIACFFIANGILADCICGLAYKAEHDLRNCIRNEEDRAFMLGTRATRMPNIDHARFNMKLASHGCQRNLWSRGCRRHDISRWKSKTRIDMGTSCWPGASIINDINHAWLLMFFAEMSLSVSLKSKSRSTSALGLLMFTLTAVNRDHAWFFAFLAISCCFSREIE